MRRVFALALAFVLVLPLAARSAPASGDDPQLDAAVQKLDDHPDVTLRLIGEYQQDPYAKGARALARLLTIYMIRSHKVAVEIDTDVVHPILQDHSDLGFAVLTLYDVGLLKYALGHDNQAPACDPAALAGLRSIVDGYRNMLRRKPDGRYPFADHLLALHHQGKLASYLEEAKAGRANP